MGMGVGMVIRKGRLGPLEYDPVKEGTWKTTPAEQRRTTASTLVLDVTSYVTLTGFSTSC